MATSGSLAIEELVEVVLNWPGATQYCRNQLLVHFRSTLDAGLVLLVFMNCPYFAVLLYMKKHWVMR